MRRKASRFRMVAEASQCVGCLLCQMRCSFRFTRTFAPSQSRIPVAPTGDGYSYEIAFAEGCDDCGLCARACLYGALFAQPRARPATTA